MSSKAEVLAKVNPTTTYIGSQVKVFVNEVTCDNSITPTYLKKSDVITTYSGVKSRPATIIKVCKEYVIAIPLTTNKNVHALCESESRFFKKGWFCNQYVTVPIELAFESYIGVYDSPKLLNNAIKLLKDFINENI